MLDAAFNEAKSLTSDNASQQDRLAKLGEMIKEWQTNVSHRAIDLMKVAATQDQARDLERSGAGKASFDGLRAILAEFKQAEESLLSVRADAMASAQGTIQIAVITSILATILIGSIAPTSSTA